MTGRCALLAIALVALGASGASADGPVIITQAKALQGGITPGDAPGFPIEIHGGGSFLLGGDVFAPQNRNVIVVYDGHVTIDLGGHTLGGGKNGISGPMSYLTVRNGDLRNFKGGAIFYTSSQNAGDFWTIENVRIRYSHFAVHTGEAVKGKGLQFRNNTVAENYVGVECGDYCQIEGNIFGHTHQAAIIIGSGTVLGNTIIGNGIGVAGNAATPAGFGNNTISNNGTQVKNVVPLAPNACMPAC